jgi:hypothetical protein
MSKSRILFLVPLMLLLSVSVTFAAFDNSHHDMRSYVAATDSCGYCHGRLDTNVFALQANNFGSVGGLCLGRCHAGAGVLATSAMLVPTTGYSVVTSDYTTSTPAANQDYTSVFFNRSHPSYIGLKNGQGGAAVTWPPAGVSFPYLSSNTTIRMQCTSCHAVHDRTNAPFIWSPLAPSAAGAFDSFCERCHQEAARSGVTITTARAAQGPHPVSFVVDNALAAARTGNGRHPRRINLQKYGNAAGTGTTAVFDVATTDNTSLTGVPNAANSWNMGGHLTSGRNQAMTNWTPTGGTQILGCYTCHGAHRTSVNGENNLAIVATLDAGPNFNPMCVGCHGPNTSWAGDSTEAAVGITAWGHPVGANTPSPYKASAGGFTFSINTAVTGLTIYTSNTMRQSVNTLGLNGRLLCTSCHQVHGGVIGQMAITNLGSAIICRACHNGTGIPNIQDVSTGGTAITGHNAANSHHVTSTSVTTAATGMPKTGDLTKLLAITNPSWGLTAGALGNISSGTMDCADCHIFNGTAHNW